MALGRIYWRGQEWKIWWLWSLHLEVRDQCYKTFLLCNNNHPCLMFLANSKRYLAEWRTLGASLRLIPALDANIRPQSALLVASEWLMNELDPSCEWDRHELFQVFIVIFEWARHKLWMRWILTLWGESFMIMPY
jgi:hypothetical protein